jgi:chemotaxis methyl-accepting protein methylase
MENKNLKIFLSAIQRSKGIDLSSYQERFFLRRLNYRISIRKSTGFSGYLELLEKDSAEFNRFLEALAINVSEFFRDAEVFDYFRNNCLRELINRKGLSSNKVIRIWSAGCAEGEEPYSLAIILKEELSKRNNFFSRIWGTDIDKGALESAKIAEYNPKSLKEIDEARLKKYFSPLPGGSFRLDEEIRQMVKFSQRDLINKSPLRFMDVIFCRNVMIYLNREQQDILLSKFHKALSSKGYLILGKVETIWGNLRNMFIPVATYQKIFQKK